MKIESAEEWFGNAETYERLRREAEEMAGVAAANNDEEGVEFWTKSAAFWRRKRDREQKLELLRNARRRAYARRRPIR